MVVPVKNTAPQIKGVVLAMVSIALGYVLVLLWLDQRKQVFAQLPVLVSAMPVILLCALTSYALRVLRFRCLLQRAGHTLAWRHCTVIYLAGFAFTASPGKLGELIRMRYLSTHGVPPTTAIGEFFYERLFDLIAVLMLSTLAIGHLPGLGIATGFVAIVASAVLALSWFPRPIECLSKRANDLGWSRVADALSTFARGIAGLRHWCTARDAAWTLALSVIIWMVVSLAFVWLLVQLHIQIDLPLALAITPLASLVGAASMLPGGLGSTELATAAALVVLGAPVATATLATVGIRLGTMWFAMLLGMGALMSLESRLYTSNAVSDASRSLDR